MIYVIYYLTVLFLTFLGTYFITYFIPMKKNKLGLQGSFRWITKKYDLNMNKERVRLLSKMIAGINSFIISIPIMLALFIDINVYLLFFISFVIFLVLIISLYNLLGSILKKKGW